MTLIEIITAEEYFVRREIYSIYMIDFDLIRSDLGIVWSNC